MLLAWTLGFALLGSLGAILGPAALLVLSSSLRTRLLSPLAGSATGTLLGPGIATIAFFRLGH